MPDSMNGEVLNHKRSFDAAAQEQAFSKSKRKRQKKKEQKALEAQRAESRASKLAEQKEAEKQNPNIRIEKTSAVSSTIAEILAATESSKTKTESGKEVTLPFINRKYKCKVQVVDYFPDALQDFALPLLIEAENDETGMQTLGEPVDIELARQQPDKVKWQWHFFLMIKDPELVSNKSPQMMLLQVEGAAADRLLNLNPCDLQRESNELDKLKEKLFLLWGDLEEQRRKHSKVGLQLFEEGIKVSSRPFECLIKESGEQRVLENGEVDQHGWERVFSIFGTTV